MIVKPPITPIEVIEVARRCAPLISTLAAMSAPPIAAAHAALAVGSRAAAAVNAAASIAERIRNRTHQPRSFHHDD